MGVIPRALSSILSLSSSLYRHKFPLKFLYNTCSRDYGINHSGSGVRHLCRTTHVEERVTSVISSPSLVALEYADLNLPHNIQEVGNLRVRQHVNPLTAAYSVPAEVPDWKAVFRDSSLPLMVDIGCGSGRFLLWLAKRNVESKNYLGLEIRKKLVTRANVWVKELSLSNAHFIVANATVSFEQLVSSYPGPLVFVTVLCPDPHFKKRHRKRRVLQKPLVHSIVNNLRPGGQVFVQSDVLDVAIDMRNQFDGVSDVVHVDAINPTFACDPDGWLLRSPMEVRTEREIHAELEGAKIYRRMYEKRVDVVSS